MRAVVKGDEDRWRAGLSGEDSNVLEPKNPGFTVFWTAGRAIAHEAEKQGVGRGEQCARASGQELTLNRPGSQGARCDVRLWGANWSMQGHRRPALSSAQAHFERARGDKQGGSAPRLPRPHLGSGTTPSNYLFERHAQAQRGAPTPSPPMPVPLRAQLRHWCLLFVLIRHVARLRSFEKSFEKPLPLHIHSLTNAPRPTRH